MIIFLFAHDKCVYRYRLTQLHSSVLSRINMSGRQGGKQKPLKNPKKKQQDEDEDDIAYKAKLKADAQAKKAMADKAKKGGPLVGGGIKKSGKK